MHIAAAPASRKEPGSNSHAAYQGGCTASPRSRIRPAPKTTAAATSAGPVKPKAQLIETAPANAATSGWTPAMARPAGTANATSRRMTLGRGRFTARPHSVLEALPLPLQPRRSVERAGIGSPRDLDSDGQSFNWSGQHRHRLACRVERAREPGQRLAHLGAGVERRRDDGGCRQQQRVEVLHRVQRLAAELIAFGE